jgi:hypothetical protein
MIVEKIRNLKSQVANTQMRIAREKNASNYIVALNFRSKINYENKYFIFLILA